MTHTIITTPDINDSIFFPYRALYISLPNPAVVQAAVSTCQQRNNSGFVKDTLSHSQPITFVLDGVLPVTGQLGVGEFQGDPLDFDLGNSVYHGLH